MKAVSSADYIMENAEEIKRLELKTSIRDVRRQARWCGVKPGQRILDVGCGPGKTTAVLHELVQPGGSAVGIDFSAERIVHAKKNYGNRDGIDFFCLDARESLAELGRFDLIWARFLLEYYRRDSEAIVRNLTQSLKPSGQLCLLDLDYNCLNHYQISTAMEECLLELARVLDRDFNFDCYAGRRLYSYLYDLDFQGIKMGLLAHHLIYGKIKESDLFNWMKKLEVGKSRMNDFFQERYQGGYQAFSDEFRRYFLDERRFFIPRSFSAGDVNRRINAAIAAADGW